MAKAKILIVDDDLELGSRLVRYLKQFDFDSDSIEHPNKLLSFVKKHKIDLVILDVMLPEMDGFEVLRMLRKQSDLPVIMLTARGDVSDRIVGLELGADDYLPKPFEPRELVARIQTVLRRKHPVDKINEQHINFGELEIDNRSQTVSMNGKDVNLTHIEFRLLKFLCENQYRLLDRNTILNAIKSMEWETFDRSIDVLISRLRNKLGDDPKKPKFIKTLHGSGYMFIGRE
ncbi:response regulator transcription factor [bacterium]|nr:response regulator transcription factor [bacterium]